MIPPAADAVPVVVVERIPTTGVRPKPLPDDPINNFKKWLIIINNDN